MTVRGLRGAITVEEDEREVVLTATCQLLEGLMQANPELKSDDIASVIFTLTPDLKSVFPAEAARQMGWTDVPLLCAQEIPVPHALSMCIRVLIHWNTSLAQVDIVPVYLRRASQLRPDFSSSMTE